MGEGVGEGKGVKVGAGVSVGSGITVEVGNAVEVGNPVGVGTRVGVANVVGVRASKEGEVVATTGTISPLLEDLELAGLSGVVISPQAAVVSAITIPITKTQLSVFLNYRTPRFELLKWGYPHIYRLDKLLELLFQFFR